MLCFKQFQLFFSFRSSVSGGLAAETNDLLSKVMPILHSVNQVQVQPQLAAPAGATIAGGGANPYSNPFGGAIAPQQMPQAQAAWAAGMQAAVAQHQQRGGGPFGMPMVPPVGAPHMGLGSTPLFGGGARM